MMLRFSDIIFTTWLLMVLINGSELDSGDGDGNDMKASVSEALTKALPQPQPSLLPDVIVETSSTFIPDNIKNSPVFHLVKSTSSASTGDVSDSQTPRSISSEVSPSVLIATTGESSSPPVIKISPSPDYPSETPSSPTDHMQSSSSRLTDGMTSSPTSGKSTNETVTNTPPPPPPEESPPSTATSIQQTLAPQQILITCPSGFVLDDSDCIPELSNITAIITGTLSQKPSSDITRRWYMDKGSLERFFTESISQIASVWNYSLSDVEVTTDIHGKREKITVKIFVECYCKFNAIPCEETIVLMGEIEAEIRIFHDYLRSLELDLKSFSAIEISGFNETCGSLKERLSCTWLIHRANQIETKNDDVIVVPTGKRYTSGMFQTTDDIVTICEKDPEVDMDSNTYVKQSLFEHEIMHPISTACLSISVLALIVRITLQFLITGCRNRPNRLQFQLSMAMLASFVGLLFTPYLADILETCTVLSVCLLYFFTAAFSWMTVIAVDTWMVFRPSAAFFRFQMRKEHHLLCAIFVHGEYLL